MSAGLVQVEAVLEEQEKDLSGNKYVLIQKCFRYFDMDQVGMDNRHLSLFDMAGAFVFGVDPERTAVENLWNFVTRKIGIDREKIWATYFVGGEVEGEIIPADDKARQAWLELGFDTDRLIGLGEADNYWVQGPGLQKDYDPPSLRKCGPNTELFYDRGRNPKCNNICRPGCPCGRFVEFANILFVEYEIDTRTKVWSKISTPFVETVIGLERVAFISENYESVFELPQYQRLMKTISEFIPDRKLPKTWVQYGRQVIADHIFALYTLVSDGAPPPGKDGRARIMKLLIRQVITQQMILGIIHPKFMETILIRASFLLDNNSQTSNNTIKTLLNYYKSARKKFERTINKGMQELSLWFKENKGRNLTGCQIVTLEKEKGLPHNLIRAELFIRGHSFPQTQYRQSLTQWRKTL